MVWIYLYIHTCIYRLRLTLKEEEEKPKDKLHRIAHELLTTERAYVARLHLLDQVCRHLAHQKL